MKLKRILTLTLTCVLAFSLAACTNKETKIENKPNTKIEDTNIKEETKETEKETTIEVEINKSTDTETKENSEIDNKNENEPEIKEEVNAEIEFDGNLKPIENKIDIKNIENNIIPASFTTQQFDLTNNTLTLSLHSSDIYDAVKLSKLKENDKIFINGKEIIVKTVETNAADNSILINGGNTNEDGATLIVDGSITYRTALTENNITTSNLGKIELKLAEDFTILDYYGTEPNQPKVVDMTNIIQYLNELKGEAATFNPNNTSVAIYNNEITSILRN